MTLLGAVKREDLGLTTQLFSNYDNMHLNVDHGRLPTAITALDLLALRGKKQHIRFP